MPMTMMMTRAMSLLAVKITDAFAAHFTLVELISTMRTEGRIERRTIHVVNALWIYVLPFNSLMLNPSNAKDRYKGPVLVYYTIYPFF